MSSHTCLIIFKVLVKKKVLNVGYSGHLYKGRGISLIIKLAKNLKDYNFNVAGGDKERVQYYRKKHSI